MAIFINDNGTLKELDNDSQITVVATANTIHSVNFIVVNNGGTLATVWNAIYNTTRATATSLATATSKATQTSRSTSQSTTTSFNTTTTFGTSRNTTTSFNTTTFLLHQCPFFLMALGKDRRTFRL